MIFFNNVPLSLIVQSNRGVSYIEYANRADAEHAIAHMDNGQLDGKVLVCIFGEPPRRRSPTPPPRRRRTFNAFSCLLVL
jgi:RNA-binding protein with serine-rich domain 1